MTSPFPGMNPYLENPDLWSEVHHRLITAIADDLGSRLSQKYRVAIEKRIYRMNTEDSLLIGIPDLAIFKQIKNQTSDLIPTSTAVITLPKETETKSLTVTIPLPLEIKHGYLEIREVSTGKVVTVVEILSPTNKQTKDGRKSYLKERETLLESDTNLIEIDLIRSGEPMPILTKVSPTDYRILIVRSAHLPEAQLYGFNVRDPIPNFPITLQLNEPEIDLNLQKLLLKIYEQAAFDLTLDYTQDPVPNISAKDREWLNNLLKQQGKR